MTEDDEVVAAERAYSEATRKLEDLRPRYERTLATTPLNEFDPIPASSAEDIGVSKRWRELEKDQAAAHQRLVDARKSN